MHIHICKCIYIYIHILTWHSRRPLKSFRFLCNACLCLRQNCCSFPIKPYCTCVAVAAHPSEKLHRRLTLPHAALDSVVLEFVACTTDILASPAFLRSISAVS